VGDGSIVIAEVHRARGLRGEVVATLHADDPSRLDGLGEVEIVPAGGGAPRSSRVEGWKRAGERVVLKLAGVETVEEARALAGSEIRIRRSEARRMAPEGRYFAYQLEGLQVVNLSGEALGQVVRVMSPGGRTLLEVRSARGEFLLPAVSALCKRIDLEAGKIVVDLPEGLIELNAVRRRRALS